MTKMGFYLTFHLLEGNLETYYFWKVPKQVQIFFIFFPALQLLKNSGTFSIVIP